MEKQILKMDLKNPLYNYISQFNSIRVNNMVNSQLVDLNDHYHFTLIKIIKRNYLEGTETNKNTEILILLGLLYSIIIK